MLTEEVSELRESNRQLLDLVEQKDLEISEKNVTVNNLNRIVCCYSLSKCLVFIILFGYLLKLSVLFRCKGFDRKR